MGADYRDVVNANACYSYGMYGKQTPSAPPCCVDHMRCRIRNALYCAGCPDEKTVVTFRLYCRHIRREYHDVFYDAYAIDGRTGRHIRDLYSFGAIGGSPSIDASSVVGQGPAGPPSRS